MQARDQLIYRYYKWLYHKALKVMGNQQDAEDAAQDVAVILLTKLSTFRGECPFRSWLCRVLTNHIMDMSRKNSRNRHASIPECTRQPDDRTFIDIPDPNTRPVEWPLLLDEIRSFHTKGVMKCLDRKHRSVYMLGDVYGLDDITGSKIIKTSRTNFRKILSRARCCVYRYMREKLELKGFRINEPNDLGFVTAHAQARHG